MTCTSSTGPHGPCCTVHRWAVNGSCRCTTLSDGTICSFGSTGERDWCCRGLSEVEALRRDMRSDLERLASARLTARQRRLSDERELDLRAQRLGMLFACSTGGAA